jgi:hypothetical protein
MKRRAIILAILLGGFLLFHAGRATCLGCIWTNPCYSDAICGSGCICVKVDGTDVGGICMVR